MLSKEWLKFVALLTSTAREPKKMIKIDWGGFSDIHWKFSHSTNLEKDI